MSPEAPTALPPSRRPELLAPYLEELRRSVETSAHPSAPSPLELEPWEAAAVAGAAEGSWQRRVAEALAFRLRCAKREEDPSRATESGAEPDEELLVEAAVGLAVQLDLKAEVDGRVASGQVREAKQLTALLHKLGQAVTSLRSSLGEDAFARAEKLARTLVEETSHERSRAKPGPKALLVEEEAPAPTQFRRDPRRKGAAKVVRVKRAGAKRSRVGMLAGVLGCSVLGYMIFVFPRTSQEALPRLELDRFAHLEAVTAVRSRPPSLFVEVDADGWAALARKDRQHLVENVGEIAAGEGYRGAHVRSTAGATVGEWLVNGGARLVEP